MFEDFFHKLSTFVVNFLYYNHIGNLTIGYNKEWKQTIDNGPLFNQTFHQIPFRKMLNMFKYKCEKCGINYVEVNESHTSKCDALAFESICHHDSYMGKRRKRGMFLSSTGKMLNADVNGALNIMRNSFGDDVVRRLIRNNPLIFSPKRINKIFDFNYSNDFLKSINKI